MMNRMHFIYRLLLMFLMFIITSCTMGRIKSHPKPLSYAVAPKTTRAHIITECIITLNAYNFTIEFANSLRNREALRSNWRTGDEIPFAASEDGVYVRDRAILHLSPRGKQPGRETTLVASSLQFEMQKIDFKKKKWIYVTPDSIYQQQYASIADDLKTRLRKKGYIFN